MQNLKQLLKQQDKQILANTEAVKSMDAFRRQVNQKILNLEKRIDQQNVGTKLGSAI